MMDVLLSELVWKTIPPLTSLICVSGFYVSCRLVVIARRDLHRHGRDSLRSVAVFLQRRAFGRAWALLLLILAGIFYGVPTWLLPLTSPPRSGLSVLLWINHYVVFAMANVLNVLAILDYRDRKRLGHAR